MEDGRGGMKTFFPHSNVPPTCTILNVEGPDDDDKNRAELITLSAIKRWEPGGRESQRNKVPILYKKGEIAFSYSTGPTMTVNPQDRGLYEFMLLGAKNEWCKDKPWHIAPKGGSYTYFLKRENELVKPEMDFHRKHLLYQNAVMNELDDEALMLLNEIVYKVKPGVFLADATRYKFFKAVDRLKDRTEKERKLDELYGLVTSQRLLAMAQVKRAEREGIIKFQQPNLWTWDTGKEITDVPQGVTRTDALLNYLLSDPGTEAKQVIKEKLAGIKA